MATTRLSDTMIRTMLDALRCRNTEGRYEIFQANRRTVESLIKRDKAETLEVVAVRETSTGRPVSTCHRTYLTEEAVTYLRNALEYVLNQRGEERDAVWQEWLSAERRNQWAAIDFLGLTADSYEVATATPQERGAHTETLNRADAWEQMGSAMTNGQRITLDDGTMTVHTKLGARWTFKPMGPAEEPQERPDRYTVAEEHKTDGTAVWTARAGRTVAVAVECPQERGMWDTDILRRALAEHAGVDVENIRPVRARNEASIAPRVWEVIRPEADTLPMAEEAPATTPEPRPAAEVLAADPIPADTSVLDGMPGLPVGRAKLVEALTDDMYVIQVRCERVWELPNHDDGAHMSRSGVAWGVRYLLDTAPDRARATVDTDGTVYASNARQAARYIPVTLLADYSADFCPGCGTPYAVNGDGPCSGGRSSLEPATLFPEEAEERPQGDPEEAANLGARFMPQEADQPGSRPTIAIGEPLSDGEVLVSVYRRGGRLVVYVDLDGCDSTENDGVVPMVIQVQGREVYTS